MSFPLILKTDRRKLLAIDIIMTLDKRVGFRNMVEQPLCLSVKPTEIIILKFAFMYNSLLHSSLEYLILIGQLQHSAVLYNDHWAIKLNVVPFESFQFKLIFHIQFFLYIYNGVIIVIMHSQPVVIAKKQDLFHSDDWTLFHTYTVHKCKMYSILQWI